MWYIALQLIILLLFPIAVGVLVGFIIHWYLELQQAKREENDTLRLQQPHLLQRRL